MADGRTVYATIRRDWREIGGLGRLGVVGLVGALGLTIALGFLITDSVERHLLESRANLVAAEVAALPVLPAEAFSTDAFEAFDVLVRQELLGGETERVKLWSADGLVLYSDDRSISSDLDDPAHARDRELGALIEFWIPVHGEQGEVLAVFEIEQSTDSLEEALGAISRYVWFAILVGVGALAVFLLALFFARVRDHGRRWRTAEALLGRLFTAQEEERRRIVGALHDDIGQPLYRILYGLEGSISRVGEDSEVGRELDRLQGLVREVDVTLRSELESLSEHLPIDAGLREAVEQLAADTAAEAGLLVEVDLEGDEGLRPVQRVALYRAVQEGIVNVWKHSGARRVEVFGRIEGGRFEVDVTDDGSATDAAPGLGLTTTRERLEAIGGRLAFVPGRHGSVLRVSVPLGEEPK
jgi:signal transduction histidine kinase